MTDEPDADRARELGLALRALLQAGREMNSALAGRLDVGVTELQAMDHLLVRADLGPAQLANLLGIRSASGSALVDRLEAAGHLRRVRTSKDRRRVSLEVSGPAKDDVRRAMQPLLDELADVADRLEPDQADLVLGYLRDVAEVLRRFAAGGVRD